MPLTIMGIAISMVIITTIIGIGAITTITRGIIITTTVIDTAIAIGTMTMIAAIAADKELIES
jgi:hypothetical protein